MRAPAPKLSSKGVGLLAAKKGSSALCATQARAPMRVYAAAADAAPAKKSVELKSDMGIDYTPLEEAMKAGNWREADDWTRDIIIKLAGEDAEIREYIYFTEVKNIPEADLKTIDDLWVTYSNGNFGYSVQAKIWKREKEMWGKFFKKLDWTTGENNAYRSWKNDEYIYKADAAKGHLPLTSCLRGTQLLRGLLQHPAISGPVEVVGADGKKTKKAGGAFSKPDWLKF